MRIPNSTPHTVFEVSGVHSPETDLYGTMESLLKGLSGRLKPEEVEAMVKEALAEKITKSAFHYNKGITIRISKVK